VNRAANFPSVTRLMASSNFCLDDERRCWPKHESVPLAAQARSTGLLVGTMYSSHPTPTTPSCARISFPLRPRL